MAAFRKWRIKLEEPGNFVDRKTVPDPPGYHANAIRDGSSGSSLARKKQGQGLKKQQALIAKAQSQFQKVFPLCLMMFMSGNGAQLFSIFTVITGIWTPVQSILRVLDVFPADDDRMVDVWSPRALYCLIHGGALLFALYKLHNMQLLPISPADWVSALEVPAAVEASAGVVL